MTDQITHISLGRAGQSAEQLSALMDGELAGDQMRFLLRGIEAEPGLAQRWSRFHLIRAALRHEVVVMPLRADFSANILGRLDGEAIAATTIGARRHGMVRWVGGGAIAAAVAVVALVVSGPVGDNGLPGGKSSSGTFAAQGAPSATVRGAYLPLRPANTLQKPELVLPASDETILQNLYAPDGSVMPRDYFSQGAEPYVLYVNPQTHRVDAPLPVQSGAPQK